MFAKRVLLASASVAGLSLALAAHAAEVPANTAESVEDAQAAAAGDLAGDIVVTGTRIRGVAAVGSNVVGLDTTNIRETGLTTTTDLLRSMPQISNIGMDESRTAGSQRAVANLTGASGINLRGLGVEATLTLVNGRRPPVGGGEGRSFDISAIPAIALQRIEVVPDGSSAIYGSDAMTGVANLITRKEYQGLEVRGRYGFADPVNLYQGEVLAGHRWGSGGLLVAFEYFKRDNLQATDRGSLFDDGAAGSVQSVTPNIGPSSAPTSGFVDRNNNGIADPGETSGNPVIRQSNWKGVDALPQQKRISTFAHLDQQAGDNVRLFLEGFYSHREFRRYAAGLIINGQQVSAANPYNATGAPITVNYSFLNDLGPQEIWGFSETWQISGGAEVDIGENWRLSGSMSYGRDEVARNREQLNNTALTAALASSSTATALNPFSNGTNGYPSQAVRDTVLASIGQVETNAPIFRFTNAQMQMDGRLLSMPGGDVRLAAGLEYQYVDRTQVIRIARAAGTSPADNVAGRLHRKVFSAFGELFIPIIGADNAGPFAQSLELSVAGRYDKYKDDQVTDRIEILNADTFNPKIGLTWKPNDELAVRASWGKSFRAPALGDYSLGAPTTTGPAQISAAVAAANGLPSAGAYTATLIQGGHTFGLEPERARNWTMGVDWRPEWAGDLTVSLTYYNVRFTNQLTAPASTSLLTDPSYVENLKQASSFVSPGSGLVIFNPTTAQLQQFLNFGGAATPKTGVSSSVLYGAGSAPAAGQTVPVYVLVEGITHNGGILKTDGLDFSLQYRKEAGFGTVSFSNSFTYILNYEQSLVQGGKLIRSINEVNFPLRFVNRAQLGFANGGFNANLFMNYMNSYRNTTVTPAANVSAYSTFDLNLSYNFAEEQSFSPLRNLTISLIAQNLFDATPPYARVVQGAAVQNFDSQNASALGRMVSIQIGKKF